MLIFIAFSNALYVTILFSLSKLQHSPALGLMLYYCSIILSPYIAYVYVPPPPPPPSMGLACFIVAPPYIIVDMAVVVIIGWSRVVVICFFREFSY
jgi:hypothetical protein